MILQEILEVFTTVGEWFASAFDMVMPIFWNSETNSLTLMGVLAVASLAFSVVFLIIGIIQRFLQFRG